MIEHSLSYREVIPDQTLPEKWKEIVLNTGGSQSTLQDIKVPERAGGYAYKDSSKYFTRNRFIYWRICHDVLELVEQSLDINLANCKVRYKFTDTPLLDGISIHETPNSIVILVVTVSSVHKLTFPHPEKIHKQEHLLTSHPDLSVQSILSEASTQSARDPHSFHVITNAGTSNLPVPHAAASWLVPPHEEALFALAYNSGIILLLKLDSLTGVVTTSELKEDSIMPRFLSGIATAFRGKNSEGQVPMSLAIHSCSNDTYLFALCREGNLRMWSVNKAQCIAMADVAIDNRVTSQGAQNHTLKKALGTLDSELFLGTYLKFGSHGEFNILKPVQTDGGFKFVRYHTLFAPDQHLVDFSFTTTRLWAVWRTTDMDTVAVTHSPLQVVKEIRSSHWETAILESTPDRDYIVTDPETDPRQAYISYIFHPGQFSLTDITRALSIYRRSNLIADMTLSPAVLKERVCMAVEAEIQQEVLDYELTDEDYLEIANRCWSKFYSCVIQYHMNGSKPVGLLLLPSAFGGVLLKKSSISILRPMEPLEDLFLLNDKSYTSRYKSNPVFSQDEDVCEDLIVLMSALCLLEEHISEEVKNSIERELYHLKSPDVIVADLLSELTTVSGLDYDFKPQLFHKLEGVKDIVSAMSMLLEALTYDLGQPNMEENDEREASRIFLNISHLFSSQLGISTMTESVSQITSLRFSICRNLLILQQIVLTRPKKFDTSLQTIKSTLAPRTVPLAQAYYVLLWICESTATCAPPQALIESSIQRLALLGIAGSRANIGSRQQRSLSLLELFIQNGGANNVHHLISHTQSANTVFTPWHYSMLTCVSYISQLIWPISSDFIFPKWLLSSCQFLLVQEYVRLLATWNEWNSSSRLFILAVSLLEMGEYRKACDNFLKASCGVLTDSFFADILLESNAVMETNPLILYYLKVINLFEQHNASDCIIELAESAISEADRDDPYLPTLHSIVFAQHLKLNHHIEAYHCLKANPDADRKVDCLRQLVVTLFDRKKLIDLVSFPYVEMYNDLERIIIGRARSVDLMENNYYNFLYSFHVMKKNYRKAASVMYEQAMRLSQESNSVAIITKQSRCLLACMNALHLVNEKYRWIVRPVVDESFSDDKNPVKKRSIDGKEVLRYKIKKQIEVLELKDIQKEYCIVDAKLKLSRVNNELHTIAQAEPSEIIVVLSSFGLYTAALNICDKFNICKSSVLESLASQCVRLSQQEDLNAWDWLLQNEIFDVTALDSNVCNLAWRLLEYLTLHHEEEGRTKLHKGVSRKILHHGAFLPEWLATSYKKRNAAELLRLIFSSGRLTEASDLAIEYINAVLGKGKENFGLKTPLVPTAPPVWLPFNTFELLLLELRESSKEDRSYIESYEDLRKTIDNYLEIVARVSGEMVKVRMNEQTAKRF